MIPADKNDGGRLPARRRCGRNLVASGEGMRPFLFAGPGVRRAVVEDVNGHVGPRRADSNISGQCFIT